MQRGAMSGGSRDPLPRVLVVHAERLPGDALARVLAACPEVGAVRLSRPVDTDRIVRRWRPDAIVALAWTSPDEPLLLRVGAVDPPCRVVAVGNWQLDPDDHPVTRLATHVSWRVLRDHLLDEEAPTPAVQVRPVAGFNALTPREHAVLAELVRGHDHREIAQLLALRAPTVRTHLQHIFAKLGVQTRHEAVVTGLRHGLDPAAQDVRSTA